MNKEEFLGPEPFWMDCEALCLMDHQTLLWCDNIVVQEFKTQGVTSRCHCQRKCMVGQGKKGPPSWLWFEHSFYAQEMDCLKGHWASSPNSSRSTVPMPLTVTRTSHSDQDCLSHCHSGSLICVCPNVRTYYSPGHRVGYTSATTQDACKLQGTTGPLRGGEQSRLWTSVKEQGTS